MAWILPIAGAAVALALAAIKPTSDLIYYLIPWMDVVRAGGAASVAGAFAIYTPPYIYLLYLGSGLAPLIGDAEAIKLINAPFVALAALALGAIVTQCARDRDRGLIASATFCVIPTVLVNAFAWGQCDIVYTSFLLLFMLFACKERPLIAALMFGIAVSFKLQAMFLSPLLLTLVLTRRMMLGHLIVIPLTYLLMMLPAAFAGRPWLQLLIVYGHQARAFDQLSVFAPNAWWFVGTFDLMSYIAGTIVGLVIAAIVGLAIALVGAKLERGEANILLIAALSAAAMPYVLPKMHDRYFFVADVLTVALAFCRPRYWIAAVLFQLGSLTTYLAYFEISPMAPGFAFVPITLGLAVLVAAVREQRRC